MLVSIIIPCFNAQEYIEECVNSVFKQTYRPIEVICVDNNSSDNTWGGLQEIKKEHPELITVKETKPGAPVARNLGLSKAKGGWIQFLDADDIIAAEKLKRQMGFAVQNSVDIIVSDYKRMNNDLTVVEGEKSFKNLKNDTINTCLSSIILTGNPIYRKEIFAKYGGWDETLTSAQDWELNLRFALNNVSFGYTPGFFLLSREVSNSLSSNWKKVSLQASIVLLKYSKHLESINLTNTSLSKIIHTHYETLKMCRDKKLRTEIIQSIQSNYNDAIQYLNPKRKLLIKLIGINSAAIIENFIVNLLKK